VVAACIEIRFVLQTPALLSGFSYMAKADTTTCDACGRRYVFTGYKDRCPVCCPEQAHKDDVSDDRGQADW